MSGNRSTEETNCPASVEEEASEAEDKSLELDDGGVSRKLREDWALVVERKKRPNLASAKLRHRAVDSIAAFNTRGKVVEVGKKRWGG